VGDLAGAGHLGVEVSADLGSALLGADVVIDFSIARAFDDVLRAALKAKVACLSGTTALSAESQARIDEAGATIAVLWAPNMSMGVQVLATLARQAVQALPGYDVEVVEAHHNDKADAPSGTATYLVRAVQQAREELEPVFGREGQVGKRRATEIGVHALRGGGVVGDHTVHLIGEHDRIEITHRAMNRDLFAEGALRAARWLVGRKPGRYQLADVLEDA
jgi:4-hydroxy-tetrahydrodipicolinate reductase